jgi:DeoR family transcriptional regulator, fructose operon transcriptional repressor
LESVQSVGSSVGVTRAARSRRGRNAWRNFGLVRIFEKANQVCELIVVQVFWDSKEVEVTLTGGYFYPRLGVQLGPICERMLNSVSADALIMGIRGITAAGISDHNTLIVESLRAMIKVARKVVLIADHSKFGIDGMIHVAPLTDVDQIVSDVALDPQFKQMLMENGIEVLLA